MILFYRLGDFYEMFNEDAMVASKELELTLTSRAGTPMCGVPHHSAEGYIKKLIDKGFKVAICEQTTAPALSKGLYFLYLCRRKRHRYGVCRYFNGRGTRS